MVKDRNKGIEGISYNHLNLPRQIMWENMSSVTYMYNALGQKVSKIVIYPDGSIKPVEYLDGFQYAGEILQFFPHAEGYVDVLARIVDGKPYTYRYKYVYNYTDHLGNIRMSYTLNPQNNKLEILEENHYFPFGLKHSTYITADKKMLELIVKQNEEKIKIKIVQETEYQYKYNGKELQDELNLNLYDYGARMYDPALGRFTTVDPLASKMPSWSPYSAFYNNPIRFIDPDGQEPTPAEAARMAAHVYGDKKNGILTGGWQVSSRSFGLTGSDLNNSSTGLKSLVYERVVNGKVTEYTYATAGTEASWKDVGADVKQPLGLSQQYAKAADNAKTISGELGATELTYVGHSLGGGEAALNALVTDRKAITFNAAGVSDITKFVEGTWKTPFKSEGKIDAYIMTTDPLNNVQNNTALPDVNGNRHYLIPTDASSIYNGHSMDNVLKNFGVKNPDEYKK